ncbi:hypothetical protein [Janthinobacterium sp. 78]|jgi:hypothetical protein|uniref:hypothetical protein n=1 Tax=Janthinobacterium sp. 78 TaxID=2135631 RepID=UPI000E324910|nr:hypothetical protein [Janthinobacterium sp. 78]
MDIRIRLVKVGALRLIIHAWAMRTMAGLFYLNALRWGAYGATARQMRLPVRYSFAAKGNFITDAHGAVHAGPFCSAIARIVARIGIACLPWR